MKKFLLLILSCTTLLSSCLMLNTNKTSPSYLSTSEVNDEDLVDKVDLTYSNVFVGITEVIPSLKTMRKHALINSVKQDLLNDYIVVGSRDFYQSDDSGYDFYKSKSIVAYNNSSIQNKLNNIEIIEELCNQRNGKVIVIRDNKKASTKIYNVKFDEKAIPFWVNNPIEIDGYLVARGVSDKEYTIPQKIESATYDCFLNIFKTNGFSNDIIVADNYENDKNFTEEAFIAGTAAVKGFKVIDYYFDKNTREYYCLGVIKKN